MWAEAGGAVVMLGLVTTGFKFLNGRITRAEDKNSETVDKIFDKLDIQNREIGEVKTSVNGMKDSLKRIERKIDNGR